MVGVCFLTYSNWCMGQNPAASIPQKIEHQFVLGYPTRILDTNKSALYLAYGQVYQGSKRFSPEAQVSYARGSYRAFISGYTGSFTQIGLHVGGRYYLSHEKRKFRPYLNLLAGLAIGQDHRYQGTPDEKTERYTNISLNSGLHFEFWNRWGFGLSMETSSQPLIILKTFVKL